MDVKQARGLVNKRAAQYLKEQLTAVPAPVWLEVGEDGKKYSDTNKARLRKATEEQVAKLEAK